MTAKQQPGLGRDAPARPGDPIDLDESVAGEEDPGASIDLANVPARKDPATRDEAPSTPAGKDSR